MYDKITSMLRTLTATRYVTPLREGGSLPAIVEAEDDGLYVLKFRGAGQGPKSLIAELVAGEIARALGLMVPEIVFMELDAALGRNEPDYEIYNLIKASVGLNLALDYLPGSLTFDAIDARLIDPLLASSIVWFDAYVSNVDRTPRNTNMLFWHKHLYLIDHGASLYFHHTGVNYLERSHCARCATRRTWRVSQRWRHSLLPHAPLSLHSYRSRYSATKRIRAIARPRRSAVSPRPARPRLHWRQRCWPYRRTLAI